jgi:hypothetical protein
MHESWIHSIPGTVGYRVPVDLIVVSLNLKTFAEMGFLGSSQNLQVHAIPKNCIEVALRLNSCCWIESPNVKASEIDLRANY